MIGVVLIMYLLCETETHVTLDKLVKTTWLIFKCILNLIQMKTVSVALVLCLNVGVDPPDVVKTSPCARLECWIDPLSSQKALEAIGANLQKQYERWQPRARYKQSLDPTVDEVKKLCSSLRRNAKVNVAPTLKNFIQTVIAYF